MGRVSKLTDQERKEMVEAYVAGELTADIAARYGVKRSYPGMLAKQAGIPPRPRSPLCDAALPRARAAWVKKGEERRAACPQPDKERRKAARLEAQKRHLDAKAIACFDRWIAAGAPTFKARYEALQDMALRIHVATRSRPPLQAEAR
jgi:hypothetical protein